MEPFDKMSLSKNLLMYLHQLFEIMKCVKLGKHKLILQTLLDFDQT